MYKIDKNRLHLRLIFIVLEFKDHIWSFSAKVLFFEIKKCKLKSVKKLGREGKTMMFQREIQKRISGAVIKIAEKAAYKTCDSACFWWQYQPKVPKALKKSK